MTDEHAATLLAPLEAQARAFRAQKDAAHRNTVLHEAAAAIFADAALRETEGECSLAEYGRELARLVEGLADAAPGPGRADGEPQQAGQSTADRAAELGLTNTEYRARSHATAVAAVRAAIPGMYAHIGHRLEDVLNEGGEGQQDEPEALPLLFWDEPAGVVYEDGRITAWLSKAVSLAHSVPAGQLILQADAGARLRRALTTALGAADDAREAAERAVANCRDAEGCHRVIPCDPGCAARWPATGKEA